MFDLRAAAALVTAPRRGLILDDFVHLRLHDLDMAGSVMCRLRAAVCGGVGVLTGREIQPSLRPQREVHAVSDKHKPEGGNPGMDLCCPHCVNK